MAMTLTGTTVVNEAAPAESGQPNYAIFDVVSSTISANTEAVSQMVGAANGLPAGATVLGLLGPTTQVAATGLGAAVHAAFRQSTGNLEFFDEAGVLAIPGAATIRLRFLVSLG